MQSQSIRGLNLRQLFQGTEIGTDLRTCRKSHQATDKLHEVIDQLRRTREKCGLRKRLSCTALGRSAAASSERLIGACSRNARCRSSAEGVQKESSQRVEPDLMSIDVGVLLISWVFEWAMTLDWVLLLNGAGRRGEGCASARTPPVPPLRLAYCGVLPGAPETYAFVDELCG